MDKKEEFKKFANLHPELSEYLKENKDASWQKLYELYDIYGDNKSVWSPYLRTSKSQSISFSDVKNMVSKIDPSSLQEHIKTAQKALGFFEELTKKGASNLSSIPKVPTSPRPINKFFGD